MIHSPRDDLLSALRNVLPPEPGMVVAHSSLSGLLPPTGFQAYDALYAITRLVDEGWTVALPAFTFSFCTGEAFDLHRSPSQTGILSQWLLTHIPQAQRTLHPIYSFAIVGPRADEIMRCPSKTTFGDDSPFGLFERNNATLVLLGCGFEYLTQFHRCEEKAAVPYRYFKTFSGDADFGQGPQKVDATMYVRDLAIDPINDFSRAVEAMAAQNQIRKAPLWRGYVSAVRTVDLAATCGQLLADDCCALVDNGPQVVARLSLKRHAAVQPAFRMAVLGSSNVHHLEKSLSEELSQLLPGRRSEVRAVPFGQLERSLIDPTSELHRFNPQARVFCDRLEDLLGARWFESTNAEDAVGRYAALISEEASVYGGWSIVHSFAMLSPSPDAEAGRACTIRVESLNIKLREALAGVSQLVWVDLAAEAAACRQEIIDQRLWHIGRFPFSLAFSRRLARRWAGLALSMLGKTSRLVVVDLDNTLWGGVIGEDGIDGIAVGGDFPGNAFVEFQRALNDLRARGVALAICSKNDEDLVLRAFDQLPSMVLKASDFAAKRINWTAKSVNIQQVAAELNVGLESILFVDDNPVEREAIRRVLPMVNILDLPADPALYVDALTNSPYLSAAFVTVEDRLRVQNFEARKVIERIREKAANLEDYYSSLGMVLRCEPLSAGNTQRALQLCHKTNQFNATTRRYELRDLQALTASGADVVVLGLEDRHSKPENIGLLILKPDGSGGGEVDTYLLSCRVLGRGLEVAVVHWALHRSAQRGWRYLRGRIVETERNRPVRSIYVDAGFTQSSRSDAWEASTSDLPVLPSWLDIDDRFEVSKAAFAEGLPS